MARLVFLPLELINVHRLPLLEVGLIMTPAAIAGALAIPIGGNITDRIGARIPVVVGLGIMGVAALGFANISLTTPSTVIAVVVAVQGFGNGLALTPNQVNGMKALPPSLLARGTAVRSSIRQIGASLGVAAMTALMTARLGGLTPPQTQAESAAQQMAFNGVFAVTFGLALGCGLLALSPLLTMVGNDRMR
jgi:DHA2 family multidrug resistance protein